MTFAARLVAYSPGGARLSSLLLDAVDWDASFPHDDVAALSLSYPSVADAAVELVDGPVEIAVEVSDGGAWVEPRNARFLSSEVQSNDAQPLDVPKFTFRGLGALLERPMVLRKADNPGKPYDSDDKRNFLSATAGQIILSVVQESRAKYSKMLQGIDFGFTASTDSRGKAWNKLDSLAFEPGTDLLRILDDATARGICDWWMQGRTLHVVNADSAAVTRSLRLNLVEATEAPVRATFEGMATRVALEGAEGRYWEKTIPGASVPYGDKILRSASDAISTDGTAQDLLARNALQAGQPRREYTRAIAVIDSAPLLDWQVGDWLQIKTRDVWESVRVFEAGLSFKASDAVISARVTLNDRFVDASVRDAKRLQGIVHGTTQNLGSGGIPDRVDKAVPAAPKGVAANSLGYWLDAIPLSSVDVSWQTVTSDTNGLALNGVDYYEVSCGGQRKRTSSTSVGFDGLQPSRIHKVTVRAVSSTGIQGKTSSVEVLTAYPLAKLDPPTKPTLRTSVGAIQVSWDGKLQGSGDPYKPPLHFAYILVETRLISTAGKPWVRWSRDHGFVHTGLTVGDKYEVRLVAVDMLGKESDPSPVATVTVESEVQDALDHANQVAEDLETEKGRVQQALDKAFETEGGVAGALEAVSNLDATLTPKITTAQSTANVAAAEAEQAKAEALAAMSKATSVEGVASGAASAAADAQLAADDAAAAAVVAGQTASDAAADLLVLAGRTGRVVRSATAPTGDDRNANNLWLNTSTGQLSEWTGSAWSVITDSRLTAASSKADAAANAVGNAQASADSAAQLAAAAQTLAGKAESDAAAAASAAVTEAAAALLAAKQDAANKAGDAEVAAKAHADAKAAAEAAAALAAAKGDATSKADAAEAAAVAAAALDAKAKADAAQAAAEAKAAEARAAAAAAQADLDNLQIGGRNLLRDSTSLELTGSDSRSKVSLGPGQSFSILDPTWVNSYRFVHNRVTDPLFFQPGSGPYTMSVEMRIVAEKPEAALSFRFDRRTPSIYSGTTIVSAGDGGWQRVATTLDAPVTAQNKSIFLFRNRGSSNWTEGDRVEFRQIKLERGNKATDWTPAPEDVDAGINAAQSTADGAEVAALAAGSAAAAAQAKADSAYSNAATADSKAVAAQAAATNARARADKAVSMGTVHDGRRSDDEPPNWYSQNYQPQTVFEFKNRTALGVPGSGSYGVLATVLYYPDSSGGPIVQEFSRDSGPVWTRHSVGSYNTRGDGDATWSPWVNNVEVAQTTANQAVTDAAVAKSAADDAAAEAALARALADDANNLASTADGRYTVATANPTAANAVGKPIGAVWEVRSGGVSLRRYVLTGASTWTQVKAGQDFVGDKAIGRAQIGDAAVGTAQVGDATITNAKIGDLSVGKLTATGGATFPTAVVDTLVGQNAFFTAAQARKFVVSGDPTNKVGDILLEDGAVTAPKVTASEELSAKVAEFLSVKTGQITWDNAAGNNAFIGSLVGNESFIRDMYSSRVVVSADNLMPDPYFDLGTAIWNVMPEGNTSAGTVSISSDVTYQSHPHSARITQKAAGNSNMSLYGPRLRNELSVMPTCTPGEKIVASCMYYLDKALPAGAITTNGFDCRIYFYKEDGTVFGNTSAGGFVTSPPVRSWFQAGGNPITVPDGAVSFYVRPTVYLKAGYTPNDAKIYIGQVEAKRQVGSVLIEDGAITTPKIFAQSITGDKMAVGALDAFQITSPLIQSVSTAKRGIKWNGSQLVGYSSDGTQSFRLDGAGAKITAGSDNGGRITLSEVAGTSRLEVFDTASTRRININDYGNFYSYSPAGVQAFQLNSATEDGLPQTYLRGPDHTSARSYIRLGAGVLEGTDTAILRMGFTGTGANQPSRFWLHGWGAFYLGGNRGYVRLRNETGSLDLNVSTGLLNFYNLPTTTVAGQNITRILGTSGMPSIYRISSLREHKLQIEDMRGDPYRVLDLRPRTFYDKTATEQWADGLEAKMQQKEGLHPSERLRMWEGTAAPKRIPGLIAEEVEQVLPELASYDGAGALSGVQYDRVGVYLLDAVKQLKTEVDDLKGCISGD